MGQEVVTVDHPPIVSAQAMTATDVRKHVQRVQQVMKGVMKKDVHFGTIPGTGKPSLYKAGAEVLCLTFHVAPSFRVEDLSDHDQIRYRVICIGTHQASGVVLGEGSGEASSNEEKYKWRDAVCAEEFEEFDADRRRSKWQKVRDGKPYQRNQVRTEPADIANTVLKMACKRAEVAMVINVTACSDIFSQGDIGDEGAGGGGGEGGGDGKGSAQRATPNRPTSTGGGGNRCTQKQANLVLKRLDEAGIEARRFCEYFKVEQVADLPFDKVDEALRWIADGGGDAGERG